MAWLQPSRFIQWIFIFYLSFFMFKITSVMLDIRQQNQSNNESLFKVETSLSNANAASSSEQKVGDAETKKEEQKSEDKEPKTYNQRPEESPRVNATFSPVEVDLLQQLAKRRDQLELREKDIQEKQNVLKTVEEKLDIKIKELAHLKKQVEGLLAEYNQKHDEKMMSLVKIYENMKPKEAARIFEELAMDVLLEVIGRMKEAKIAPILAQMNPARAKDITIQMAQQKKPIAIKSETNSQSNDPISTENTPTLPNNQNRNDATEN
jgi:flagellar motility protein MotE (MotC chaperone)